MHRPRETGEQIYNAPVTKNGGIGQHPVTVPVSFLLQYDENTQNVMFTIQPHGMWEVM